jgi:hypothetical protein
MQHKQESTYGAYQLTITNDKQANIHIQDIAKQTTGEGHGVS